MISDLIEELFQLKERFKSIFANSLIMYQIEIAYTPVLYDSDEQEVQLTWFQPDRMAVLYFATPLMTWAEFQIHANKCYALSEVHVFYIE